MKRIKWEGREIIVEALIDCGPIGEFAVWLPTADAYCDCCEGKTFTAVGYKINAGGADSHTLTIASPYVVKWIGQSE